MQPPSRVSVGLDMTMTVRDANLLFIPLLSPSPFSPPSSDVLIADNCNAKCKVQATGVLDISIIDYHIMVKLIIFTSKKNRSISAIKSCTHCWLALMRETAVQ